MKPPTDPETLATRAEIREMLGVSKQRVHALENFPAFPPPLDVLGSGKLPIWSRAEIEAYAKDRVTAAGRPPTVKEEG